VRSSIEVLRGFEGAFKRNPYEKSRNHRAGEGGAVRSQDDAGMPACAECPGAPGKRSGEAPGGRSGAVAPSP